ncbi:hypothetical protein TNCV_3800041 [Trichonephila clavipes]|nr:hypothetical protein TNCV_3800041 [Trichonephila clavipes]
MDALKLRRTPLRTAFTKAVNHLQEIIENDPVDKNAVETAFEMLDAKSVKLKKNRRGHFRINDRDKLYARSVQY